MARLSSIAVTSARITGSRNWMTSSVKSRASHKSAKLTSSNRIRNLRGRSIDTLLGLAKPKVVKDANRRNHQNRRNDTVHHIEQLRTRVMRVVKYEDANHVQ